MATVSTLIRWMLAGTCLAPTAALAGQIRGTVRVPDAGAVSAPGAPDSRPVTDAVVYLEQIPPRLEKRLARRAAPARLRQGPGGFAPHVLAVGPGTTVRFENRGRTWHNVFSISPTKPFDVGKYAPRQSREVVFDRPGVVPLLCELDPDESGFVFVAPNHAFARPDRAGAFVLAGIPGGEYRLVVWHPGFGRLERDVTVPRRGGVTVALRL